ncbi:hypothetical protein NKH77_09160 [Streptomyces sp. M19]
MVTASIAAFGDVVHTFVQRSPDVEPWRLPGLVPVDDPPHRRRATPSPGSTAWTTSRCASRPGT